MLKMKTVCLVVLLMVVVGTVAVAQSRPVRDYPGMVARASQSGPQVITKKEVLKATVSNSGNGGITASCASALCFAPSVAIYSPSVVCPGAVGKTCTYDIQISGQVESGGNSIMAGEDGLYQFLVDGAIPNGGGTDGSGYYSWQYYGPVFAFGTSYNVHSTVTNNAANQAHSIAVNLSCFDLLDDPAGCFALVGFQTLVVRVWQP